jgi:hypothetical protein
VGQREQRWSQREAQEAALLAMLDEEPRTFARLWEWGRSRIAPAAMP